MNLVISELVKTWANTTASRTHGINYYENFIDTVNKGDIIVSRCPPYDCVDKTS
jgi:LDH2 family malate/lactate/ureidoglycolate dehydrogenase